MSCNIREAFDSQNRRTGPTSDSTWEANIPGSFYIADNLADTTAPRVILLPKGDVYNIQIISRSSNSSFDLSLKDFNDGVNTFESVYDSIPIMTNSVATCRLLIR